MFKFPKKIAILVILLGTIYVLFIRPYAEQTNDRAEQKNLQVLEEIYETETGENFDGYSKQEIEQIRNDYGL